MAWIGAAVAYSAQTGTSKPATGEPTTTTITSEKLTVRNQENKAIFQGSVVLTKGSLVVHSDEMVILFRPSDQAGPGGKAGDQAGAKPHEGTGQEKGARSGAADTPVLSNQSISLVEATGRVRIERSDGRATSKKAIYYADEDKIVLTGDPVAWQKGTRVTGKIITMYLAEERSVVEGGSRVMIEPEPGGVR
jgi:lipopolysaccharide export system protein LptA